MKTMNGIDGSNEAPSTPVQSPFSVMQGDSPVQSGDRLQRVTLEDEEASSRIGFADPVANTFQQLFLMLSERLSAMEGRLQTNMGKLHSRLDSLDNVALNGKDIQFTTAQEMGYFLKPAVSGTGSPPRANAPSVKKPSAPIAPLCLHASPVDPELKEFTENSGVGGAPSALYDPLTVTVGNETDYDGFCKTEDGVPPEFKDGEESWNSYPGRGSLGEHARSTLGGERLLFGDSGGDRTDLALEVYDVSSFYYDKGIAQHVARADWFSNCTLAVIFMNTVYIGVESDNNRADSLKDADISFQISDHAFCVFFTGEWLIRFLSFKYKRDCIKDMWFKFDSALVLLMVLETWVLPLFLGSGGLGIPTGMVKMLRLLRLARMARLMRAFPELVAMIKGVRVASRAVLSALLMNVLLIYIFGVVMNILLKESSHPLVLEKFGRLLPTMMTLLLFGTFMDSIGYVFRDLKEDDQTLAQIIMLLFVLASALTVMNMLIGVLCEVVTQVAETEKEDNAVKLVKDNLLVIIREMDEDGSGTISKDEIQLMLENEAALEVLDNLGVDLGYLMEQMDMFYSETEDIAAHRIIDTILMLRANRPPTIKDIVHGQKFTRWKITSTVAALEDRLKIEMHSHHAPHNAPHSEHHDSHHGHHDDNHHSHHNEPLHSHLAESKHHTVDHTGSNHSGGHGIISALTGGHSHSQHPHPVAPAAGEGSAP